MKTNRFITLCTTLAALAMAAVVFVPETRAEEKSDAAAKRAQREKEKLEKYDKNNDGKLDAVEKAAVKEDREKAKAEKKKLRDEMKGERK